MSSLNITDQTKPNLKYTWPRIDARIERAVMRQLHTSLSIYNRSGIIAEFEDEFARLENSRYALLCNSGTTALHSMYVAADFGPDDEVICPAYTFFATVTPLLFTGALPILADCDESGNIDPEAVLSKITPRTKAVVITHMWGNPGDLESLTKICDDHNLLLLQDCSHAHGASINGLPLGAFGDMAAWSLQGSKNITGGEGGVLVCNKEDFYFRALALGHYNKRCKQEIPKTHSLAKFATTGMGLKYRAHPLAVAISKELLNQLPMHLATRSKHANIFNEALSSLSGISIPKVATNREPAWYAYVMQYRPLSGQPSLEELIKELHNRGFTEFDNPGSTGALNLLPLFEDLSAVFPQYHGKAKGYKKGDFPCAEAFERCALKLPVWAFEDELPTVHAYASALKNILK